MRRKNEYGGESDNFEPTSEAGEIDSGDAEGDRWVYVGLKAPELIPVLTHCRSEAVRHRLYVAAQRQCIESNGPVLAEIVALKHETAVFLGYPTHAHCILEQKMAKTPAAVLKFLDDFASRTRRRFDSNLEKLLELKQADDVAAAGASGSAAKVELQPWDISFYSQKLKLDRHQLDTVPVKQHFPLTHVMAEILSIYQELLSLKFVRDTAAAVWYPDVQRYNVYDARESSSSLTHGRHIGAFYFDLFPRDGKYGHQCAYPQTPTFTTSHDTSGTDSSSDDAVTLPEAVNIGNLNKQTSTTPALLEFSQVVTFFHEFGHIMHALCTRARYSRHSWAWDAVPWAGGVEGDILEAPSQMLENWVYQPSVLRRLSSHHVTGDSLPSELIVKLSELQSATNGRFSCLYTT